jgi:hypothetical protein
MFRLATDHHQGAHLFLVKITELKVSIHSGDVVMRQHNMFCFYVVSGVVRHAESACLTTPDTMFLSVFNERHFKLMF